mmetsp:Transcript_28628/g.56254  ORF Transcript_28628/g.56254 Transcript_28628/m.56254 type:complete len:371 (+) Transcript_28628:24-1136(+)
MRKPATARVPTFEELERQRKEAAMQLELVRHERERNTGFLSCTPRFPKPPKAKFLGPGQYGVPLHFRKFMIKPTSKKYSGFGFTEKRFYEKKGYAISRRGRKVPKPAPPRSPTPPTPEPRHISSLATTPLPPRTPPKSTKTLAEIQEQHEANEREIEKFKQQGLAEIRDQLDKKQRHLDLIQAEEDRKKAEKAERVARALRRKLEAERAVAGGSKVSNLKKHSRPSRGALTARAAVGRSQRFQRGSTAPHTFGVTQRFTTPLLLRDKLKFPPAGHYHVPREFDDQEEQKARYLAKIRPQLTGEDLKKATIRDNGMLLSSATPTGLFFYRHLGPGAYTVSNPMEKDTRLKSSWGANPIPRFFQVHPNPQSG